MATGTKKQIAVVTLIMVAFLAVHTNPMDDSPTWGTDLLITKLIALMAVGAAWLLNRYWITEEPASKSN